MTDPTDKQIEAGARAAANLGWPVRDFDLREDIRAILTAALSADDGSGWLPIEQAPRDGRPILFARDMGEPWGWVIGWGTWEDIKGISGWCCRGGFYEVPGTLGLGNPTHFRPLPSPPGV